MLNATLVKPPSDEFDPKTAFDTGPQTFAQLFRRWMDSNGWSHPVMAKLATAAMGGQGVLHSSQISTFRRGTAINPGPRTFIGIERLNYYVWRYRTQTLLIPGTDSSNHYAEAQPITENGELPSLGWYFEVFCGYRIPSDYDLDRPFITEAKALEYSRALGRLIRSRMVAEGLDPVDDISVLLHRSYPIRERDRRKQMEELIRGNETLSPEDLEVALPAITKLTQDLGGPVTQSALLKLLETKTELAPLPRGITV